MTTSTADKKQSSPPPNKKDELLASVDGDFPFLDSERGDPNREAATYQATTVRVDASSKRTVPIPILVADSVVEWKILLGEEDSDVGFAIRRQEQVVEKVEADDDDDDDDVEEDDTWLVKPHWVYASETEISPTEQGQFTLKGTTTTTFPTAILMEFDNSYSWITEKTVSYSVTVTPPSDPRKVQRSERAQQALSKVMTEMEQAHATLALADDAVEEASRNVTAMAEQVHAHRKQVEEQEQVLQQRQLGVEEATVVRQNAKDAMETTRNQLSEKQQQLTHIEQEIQKLQQQRVTLLQEQETLQNTLLEQEQDVSKLDHYHEETCQDYKAIQDALCDLHCDVLMQDQSMVDGQTAYDEAVAKQQDATRVLQALERQVEALRLRLL